MTSANELAAPERIWADLNMGIWLGAPQPDRRPVAPTEYVRADLTRATSTAGAWSALEHIRRLTDERNGPSRSSLLSKIAAVADAALSSPTNSEWNAAVEALNNAEAALREATAILGGEYGDHYATLCDRMMQLDEDIASIRSLHRGEAQRSDGREDQ